MAITIKINSVDKSSLIDWHSVAKNEVLTKQPSTLSLRIRSYPSKSFAPAMNDLVQMYDGASLIFAGNVSEIDTSIDGLLVYYDVVAKDFIGLADSKVVAKAYSNQTGTQIVQDIFSTIITGFTTTNVNCPVLLDSITFNYLTIAQAMQRLVLAVGGGYDWYVDYAKDVHFFQTGSVLAPFSLDDVSGNHNYQSLTFKNDLSQLKNKITVRGTSNTSASVTTSKVADGTQLQFQVGYFGMTGFTAQKALAASPGVFTSLTVGQDGIDSPASFDCLYNPNQGILIFPSATRPAVGDVIRWTGTPTFPVISQVQDSASIAAYGIFEYVIVDRSISSKQNATNKAQAELLLYKDPIVTGTFRTQKAGLVAGQVIAIACPKMGISGAFKVQRIATSLRTPSAATSDFFFDVDFVSTTSISMVDVLNRLLLVDPTTQVTVDVNEIVDTILSSNETVTATESVSSSLAHNPQSETVTAGESFVNNGLNFGTIFVAGVQVPSTTKRVFVLNGSTLG